MYLHEQECEDPCLFFEANKSPRAKCFGNTVLNTLAPAFSLSPRNRVLKKLTVANLVKLFPATQGTRKFIIVLITLHHLSFPKAINAVHTPQPISLRYVVILPSYQHVGLPRCLAPFRFHEKNSACIFYFSLKSHVSCPSHHTFPDRATHISRATACRVLGGHRASSNEKTPCNAFPGNAKTKRRNTF